MFIMKKNGKLEAIDVENIEFGRNVKRLKNLKHSIENAKTKEDLFNAVKGLPLCDIVNDCDVVLAFRRKTTELNVDLETVHSWFEYLP